MLRWPRAVLVTRWHSHSGASVPLVSGFIISASQYACISASDLTVAWMRCLSTSTPPAGATHRPLRQTLEKVSKDRRRSLKSALSVATGGSVPK